MSESKYSGDTGLTEGGVDGVKVYEHENARRDGISYHPKEVLQQCKDLKSYFTNRLKGQVKLRDGESWDSIRALEEGPQALQMLIEEVSGGLWFYDFEQLNPEEINEVVGDVKEGYVPFARNLNEDLLVAGVHDHNGGVFEYDEDGLGEKRASCMAAFLESYCKELMSNALEFLGDDCGFVETEARVPSCTTTRKK